MRPDMADARIGLEPGVFLAKAGQNQASELRTVL
jgi:hypothetical protein